MLAEMLPVLRQSRWFCRLLVLYKNSCNFDMKHENAQEGSMCISMLTVTFAASQYYLSESQLLVSLREPNFFKEANRGLCYVKGLFSLSKS